MGEIICVDLENPLRTEKKGFLLTQQKISMNIWSHKNRLALAVFAFPLCNIIANILTNKFSGSSANGNDAFENVHV